MRRDLSALRQRVALTPVQYPALVELDGGDAAFDALDAAVTCDLYLQPAQLRQALLLDDDGLIVADALVGRERDGYLLAFDGGLRAGDAMLARLPALRSLAESHRALGLHGPFAWELLGEWLGPDLVGMPYLSSFRAGDALVLRAGNTGEYGYEVWLPARAFESMRADLLERGRRFDLVELGESALAIAALENGFFSARGEGCVLSDPLELQLRWRLSAHKRYRGREAIDRRAAQGARRRLTWLRSEATLAAGDRVLAFGGDIGVIAHALSSEHLGGHVGVAALALPWAHAGIDAFVRARRGEEAPIRTVSPPLVDNWSLRVSPQRHAYSRRGEIGLAGHGATP